MVHGRHRSRICDLRHFNSLRLKPASRNWTTGKRNDSCSHLQSRRPPQSVRQCAPASNRFDSSSPREKPQIQPSAHTCGPAKERRARSAQVKEICARDGEKHLKRSRTSLMLSRRIPKRSKWKKRPKSGSKNSRRFEKGSSSQRQRLKRHHAEDENELHDDSGEPRSVSLLEAMGDDSDEGAARDGDSGEFKILQTTPPS